MNLVTAKSVVLMPHISEKSYAQSSSNVYSFEVSLDVNKVQVKQAVEEQFAVTVTDVRSQIRKGKEKKSARRHSQPVSGRRSDKKLVFVTLKSGDSLPLFEELK